jgi:hypothetical protein
MTTENDLTPLADSTEPPADPGQSAGKAAASARPSRGPEVVERFVVRLPTGLREQIRLLSDHHRRSMNCEIVAVLEGYIRKQLEQQLAEAHGESLPSMKRRKTDAELRRRLDSLTKEKKAALLELLG